MQTLCRRFRAFGFVMSFTISSASAVQHRQCLYSYRERHWEAEWHSVVFSDELQFCLGMQFGRRRVRRSRGDQRDIGFDVKRLVHEQTSTEYFIDV